MPPPKFPLFDTYEHLSRILTFHSEEWLEKALQEVGAQEAGVEERGSAYELDHRLWKHALEAELETRRMHAEPGQADGSETDGHGG